MRFTIRWFLGPAKMFKATVLGGITIALGSLCLAITLVKASDPTITTFDVSGATDTVPVGINDSGQVAGNWFVTNPASTQGFIRDATGTITTFNPTGSAQTLLYGINTSGQVAGLYFDNQNGGHGFVRSGQGTITPFDVQGGSVFAAGTAFGGINNLGAVTGSYNNVNGVHGFVRDAQGTITTFDAPNVTVTEPRSINDLGQVTGNTTDSSNKDHGFVRSAQGTITTFDPSGSTSTLPRSINNLGQIAGYFRGSDGRTHSFVRDAQGTITTFDASGARDTFANGINNFGEVTGSYTDTINLSNHAFVRNGQGAITTFDVPNATGTVGIGINNRIQVTGVYRSNSHSHGFIAAFVAPFASFSVKIDINAASRSFDVNSTFALRAGESISPLTQDLAFQLGGYSVKIPAGSFRRQKNGNFVFEGTINGVALEAKITPLGGGSYSFKIEGAGAPNLPVSNPVTVGLVIGNNGGTTQGNADFGD